jgi:hypothetical protein
MWADYARNNPAGFLACLVEMEALGHEVVRRNRGTKGPLANGVAPRRRAQSRRRSGRANLRRCWFPRPTCCGI